MGRSVGRDGQRGVGAAAATGRDNWACSEGYVEVSRDLDTRASKLSFWRLEIWTSGKAHGPMGELAGRPSPGMMGPVQVASA